jgi:quinol monooxygenase YgiN
MTNLSLQISVEQQNSGGSLSLGCESFLCVQLTESNKRIYFIQVYYNRDLYMHHSATKTSQKEYESTG